MVNNNDDDKEEGKEKEVNLSKETIRKIVDFAINQNPLVYKRLAQI